MTESEVSPLDQIGEIMGNLQSIADLDPSYAKLADSIQSVYYGLQDVQGDLSRQVDTLEYDDGRLDEVEKRLELISQLERKYGADLKAVIAYGAKADAELASMTANDADEEGLEKRVTAEHQALLKLGAQLRSARKHAANQLISAIHGQLKALYMEKTVFSVRFSKLPADTLRSDGIDNVEFYIQTNPGEAAKPLAKIASGGELSRIMLALKTIFAETDGVTSIIFDEVDTGVSGRVAQAIANKISAIARHSQVLCISHLPQVAAMSDHEFLIQKQVAKGRTTTSVTKLDHAGRVQEIARMLAGEQVTKLSVAHASEMLKLAEEAKQQ